MCYQVGHLDVEEAVGVLVLVDVGQSSGVRMIFLQRSDPGSVMVMKYSLKTEKGGCSSNVQINLTITQRFCSTKTTYEGAENDHEQLKQKD